MDILRWKPLHSETSFRGFHSSRLAYLAQSLLKIRLNSENG
jgi:hypothetical protein